LSTIALIWKLSPAPVKSDIGVPGAIAPASAFVPALAQVNDRGATIRRIAEWTSFNDEQQVLLKRFDHWRLVVRKGDSPDQGLWRRS
jgi:hypothetical protein